MLQKFKQHLHQNFPFLEDSKLLIAISGGIDSVVLAHLCSQLNLNFSLCHCNFNLRGQESDDDEEGSGNDTSARCPNLLVKDGNRFYLKNTNLVLPYKNKDLRSHQ